MRRGAHEESAAEKKRCLASANNQHRRLTAHWHRKEGKPAMKYLAIALAAAALSFGACANKSDTSGSYSNTSTTASTGYSK